MSLLPVSENEINQNVFQEVGKEWMLITAGTKSKYNTMTASWGTFGVLWGRNVAVCFVRPTRYTFEFMESSEYYTLSFFPSEYHEALLYCGTHSGRDIDKVQETGLTSVGAAELDPDIKVDAVTFQESRLVFVCKKLYTDVFEASNFVDAAVDQEIYPGQDHHTMYIGQIVTCLKA